MRKASDNFFLSYLGKRAICWHFLYRFQERIYVSTLNLFGNYTIHLVTVVRAQYILTE
jgi:hypothetical protein